MKCALGIFVALVVFGTASVLLARAAPDRPGTHAPTATALPVVPWLEYVSTPGMYEQTLRGLREWRTVTDRAILSIVYPRDYSALRTIRASVPGLRIIPGLTTSHIVTPHDYADVHRWEDIAGYVAQLLRDTGERTCLIENELALNPYKDGQVEIDLDRFRECLQKLPRDVRYIWYPAVASNPKQLERFLRLNRIVQEVCDAEFVDHVAMFGPVEANDPFNRTAATELRATAKRPPVPLLYFLGDDKMVYDRVWWWRDAQLPELLRLTRQRYPAGDWAIIYTGAKRFSGGAQSLAGVLLSRQPDGLLGGTPAVPAPGP